MIEGEIKKQVKENQERCLKNEQFIERTLPVIVDGINTNIKSIDEKATESLSILKNGLMGKIVELSGKIQELSLHLNDHLSKVTDEQKRIKELEDERSRGWKNTRKSKWEELTLTKKIGAVSAIGTLFVTFSLQIGKLLEWLGNWIQAIPK